MISAWRKDSYEVGEFDIDANIDSVLHKIMAEIHHTVTLDQPYSDHMPSTQQLVLRSTSDGGPNASPSGAGWRIGSEQWPLSFLACAGLCFTFLVTTIIRSSLGDLGAMLAIALIIFIERDQLKSYHVALVGLLGLLCSIMGPQEIFFFSLLALAAYVAIEKEGLLSWLGEHHVNELVNMSLIDVLESPFEHDARKKKEKRKDPTQSLTTLKTLTSLLTRDGFLFASLPAFARYALLPAPMRLDYEQRRLRLFEDLRREQNRSATEKVAGVVAKTIEKVEESVTDRLLKDVEWLASRVHQLEDSIHRNPVVWWIETISKRVRRNSELNGKDHPPQNARRNSEPEAQSHVPQPAQHNQERGKSNVDPPIQPTTRHLDRGRIGIALLVSTAVLAVGFGTNLFQSGNANKIMNSFILKVKLRDRTSGGPTAQ